MKGLVLLKKRVVLIAAVSIAVAAFTCSLIVSEMGGPRWAEVALSVFWAAVVLAGPVAILVSHVAELAERNRKNREWAAEHDPGERLRCLDCKYCRVKVHHPFSTPEYRGAMTSRHPAYCRRFHRPLNWNPSMRCNAELSWQAMYERKSSASERR